MRFGVMSSQLDLLVPSNVSPEQLLNHLGDYSHADLIREIVASGFKTIELSGDLQSILPNLYNQNSIQELKKIKSDLNLTYTVHLPLWSVEPSTMLPHVRAGSVSTLIEHIRLVAPLEPDIYVLHATGALAAEFFRMNLPAVAKDYLLRNFQLEASGSVSRILSETGIQKRKLAIETIEFPLDLTLEIAVELDVSICFDTGHILAGFSGAIGFFEALDLCLDRVAEIHLHDCPAYNQGEQIGYGKDHQTLGNGDLEINRFLDLLIEENFSGPIIFELDINQALESFNLIRKVKPEITQESKSENPKIKVQD
jgi:sugar phosphate isomerase/epimerase